MPISGTLAYYVDPPFVQAVYKTEPCGCTIEGNGTLPHPLRISFCTAHAYGYARVKATEAGLPR